MLKLTYYYMASGKNFPGLSFESDPFTMFSRWYNEHLRNNPGYPGSFSLASSDNERNVSARIVLLKEYNFGGFIFYTNYESKKGIQISENNKVAMLFYWPESSRQVRVEGKAYKISTEESARYFASRPRESQIGAWASNQDIILPDRVFLENRYREYESEFMGKDVPLPPYWGGFNIVPSWFEFWQEGNHRLHNRISFNYEDKRWKISLLSP